jgi:hypothetical protein
LFLLIYISYFNFIHSLISSHFNFLLTRRVNRSEIGSMPVHYLNRHVELSSHQDVEEWTSRLGASYEQLIAAVNAVGPRAVDVEAYLKASQETVGDYVSRMRARLDQIEILVSQLADERKSIVGFLEGFAQLQRNSPPTLNALAFAVSLNTESDTPSPDYIKAFEELAFPSQTVTRSGIPTGSAPVLDVVYRLLQDGRRRTVHEILAFLDVRGIPLKGNNQAGFLSTLLSRDPRFDANRRDGWGLS